MKNDARPMGELTGIQRDLLIACYAIGEGNGSDIWDVVENVRGRRISRVAVYNNLDELDDRGLIDKQQIDGRENSYSITAEGRDLVEAEADWLAAVR